MVSLRCPCPGDRTIPISGSDTTFHTRDFWVDVRVREFDGRWLAVADLADEPEIGLGWSPRAAVAQALTSPDLPRAAEMAAGAEAG